MSAADDRLRRSLSDRNCLKGFSRALVVIVGKTFVARCDCSKTVDSNPLSYISVTSPHCRLWLRCALRTRRKWAVAKKGSGSCSIQPGYRNLPNRKEASSEEQVSISLIS